MNPKLEQMLSELKRTAFYGKLEVEYQGGEPVLIRKTQTFKLHKESSEHGPRTETR